MIGDLINAGVNLFSGIMNRNQQQDHNAQQAAMQREFAQSGIQWKVADAQKAGIHPLAALGTQTASYSPQTLGDTSFGDMGQSLGRAVKAAMSKEDRQEEELKSLALERARLDNDLVRSQINASRAATTGRARGATGPAMPTLKSSLGFPVKTDDIKSKPDTFPAVQNIRPGGIPLKTWPWFSDAQDVEDRYGEVLSDWVAGPVNAVADSAYTAGKAFKKYVHDPLSNAPPSAYARRFAENRSRYRSRFAERR